VVIDASVPLNDSSLPPLVIKVLTGCMTYPHIDRYGNEYTCFNARDSNNDVPECFENVKRREMGGMVGINQKMTLWGGDPSVWKSAIADLLIHWNTTFERQVVIDEKEALIVDLLTESEYDDLRSLAKRAFIVLFVFIHVTVLACLCCWNGCYWISLQTCTEECFDDNLFAAGDEEGRSLMSSRNYQDDNERTHRLNKWKVERAARQAEEKNEEEAKKKNKKDKNDNNNKNKKDKKKVTERREYDVLEGDNEQYPL